MEIENENIKNFTEHLEKRHGKEGSESRIKFEIKAKSFAIGELIKEERKLAHLTQEQLADKIGAKKSFISRIENDASNMTLKTLFDIVEKGLGGKLKIQIEV